MPESPKSPISGFVDTSFRHFNAGILRQAAESYRRHIDAGGSMLLAMGGAMSTAEIGVSLADMIRNGKIHAVSCTGANLEEDLFNLVAGNHYERVPNFRHTTPEQDAEYLNRRLNRITDTCIDDTVIWNRLERPFMDVWMKADAAGERRFPHEFLFEVLRSDAVRRHHAVDPRHSWTLAAMERDIPIVVPGWEDSSLGNMYAAACIRGEVKNVATMRSGIEAMMHLADWYEKTSRASRVGFFQIGGGISGDFPICVVPMLRDDLQRDVPMWAYFCQISDSTTSYGSYSGAPPTEKISWGKLEVSTPAFVIESDATIVAPLIFAYVLGR